MFLKAQGDVLIRQVANVPQEAKPVGRDDERVVLAYGEVTGHAHAISEKLAQLFLTPDGRQYLNAGELVHLVHEEHDTIQIPPGNYEILLQREYSPESIQRVLD